MVYDRSAFDPRFGERRERTLLLTWGWCAGDFLFLRNISATIIASLALPMSIVGTFAAMSLLGFSMDICHDGP